MGDSFSNGYIRYPQMVRSAPRSRFREGEGLATPDNRQRIQRGINEGGDSPPQGGNYNQLARDFKVF